MNSAAAFSSRKLQFAETKTASSLRTLSLDEYAIDTLRDHEARMRDEGNFDPHGLMFCSPRGGPLRRSNFNRDFWSPLRAATGIKVRFHDLRHTGATLMLANGVNARVVQERLGHANVSTTLSVYSHVIGSMDREAASLIGDTLRKTEQRDADT